MGNFHYNNFLVSPGLEKPVNTSLPFGQAPPEILLGKQTCLPLLFLLQFSLHMTWLGMHPMGKLTIKSYLLRNLLSMMTKLSPITLNLTRSFCCYILINYSICNGFFFTSLRRRLLNTVNLV